MAGFDTYLFISLIEPPANGEAPKCQIWADDFGVLRLFWWHKRLPASVYSRDVLGDTGHSRSMTYKTQFNEENVLLAEIVSFKYNERDDTTLSFN